VLLAGTTLCAQTRMPVGIVHGTLISAEAGELTVRNSQNAVYGCSYDGRTYFEREHQSISAGGLAAGDPVEVLADRRAGSSCYARTVQVVPLIRRAPRVAPLVFRPRGNLTFGGTVVRYEGRDLTVRTRRGDVRLRLRGDTRFVSDGLRVEAGELAVNQRVFVRGGRNLEGELEGYEVMWGEIVVP
jgi:Domain of unknown function (DUF5666)